MNIDARNGKHQQTPTPNLIGSLAAVSAKQMQTFARTHRQTDTHIHTPVEVNGQVFEAGDAHAGAQDVGDRVPRFVVRRADVHQRHAVDAHALVYKLNALFAA